MKKNISLILLSLLTLVSFTQCEDKEFKYSDASVAEVKTYYSPVDKKNLKLSALASEYFEWERTTAQDNGVVYYDVLFDKVDGDFSKPVYIATADNKGISPGATMTHKILNKIAGLAGIASSEEGTVKWTVIASRGLSKSISSQSRTMTITRLSGIDAPSALYITGEATEGGTDMSEAVLVKGLAGGTEFEVYTKLTAGKTYKFVDSKKAENSRTFVIVDGLLKEEDGTIAVDKTGVYAISLDFSTGAAVLEEVQSIGLWNCVAEQVIFDLPYAGKGVWSNTGKLEYPEDRYKISMTLVKADGTAYEQFWGTVNAVDSSPAENAGPEYYYIKKVNDDRWNDKWKFTSAQKDAQVEASVSLTTEDEYTHFVGLK